MCKRKLRLGAAHTRRRRVQEAVKAVQNTPELIIDAEVVGFQTVRLSIPNVDLVGTQQLTESLGRT